MKRLLLLLAAVALPALVSSCGLFGNSDEQAIVGGGAIAGKDYVCGLQPSDNARDYFNSLSDDAPIETVRRTDEKESKSGVRFVNNGGILIPPGVTISFDNHGYCMDPHLPAPKSGEDYQLVPMSRLIPEELTDTYKNLIAQESAGNSAVRSNMQHLVWALRTAGTDAAYANNLTSQQKQILDQCSDGIFESFHESKKAGNKIINELLNMADSVLNVTIGGVTYKASDLLDPDIGSKKINEHMNQLIDLSEYLPVENIGLNYGEIEPGIYTDVVGTGYLQYHAKIANATNQPYIFYPSDWVGQVGSPAKSSGVFAAADSTMRQRVTGKNQDKVVVEDQSEQEESETCPPHSWHGQINGGDEIELDLSARDEISKRLNSIRNKVQNMAQDLRDRSAQTGKEYGFLVYVDSSGALRTTRVTEGKNAINNSGGEGHSWNFSDAKKDVPENSVILAYVHSHPPRKGFWDNPNSADVFSAEDLGLGYACGLMAYMVSPVNDNVWEFDPYNTRMSYISGTGHVIDKYWRWNRGGDAEQEDELERFDDVYLIFCTKCGKKIKLSK